MEKYRTLVEDRTADSNHNQNSSGNSKLQRLRIIINSKEVGDPGQTFEDEDGDSHFDLDNLDPQGDEGSESDPRTFKETKRASKGMLSNGEGDHETFKAFGDADGSGSQGQGDTDSKSRSNQ